MNDKRIVAANADTLILRSTLLPSVPGMMVVINAGVLAFITSVIVVAVFLWHAKRVRGLLRNHAWYRFYVSYFFVSTLVVGFTKMMVPTSGKLAIGLWVVVSISIVVACFSRWVAVIQSGEENES